MTCKKYLTYEQVVTLITSIFPNEKASLLASIMRDIYIVHKSVLYEAQENITYTPIVSEIKMTVLNMTTLIIQESFNKLSKDQKKLLTFEHSKTYASIFTNSSVEKYYPQLYKQLERNEINFDDYVCEIHFNNGYLDLNTLQFKQRILHQHYITQVIKRDYEESTKEQKKEVLKHIKKIYPKKEDLDSILLILGSCLSGKANIDQDLLFLLGKGSSGKSFILELTKQSVEMYLKELKDDTFSLGNSKTDKILNTFVKSPYVRITWINELKDTKMDDSLFKQFCDGKAQTTKLYEDGSVSITLKSKAIITANTMPNIKNDSGTKRRILAYNHRSSFTDSINDVDENNHIYLKDKQLIEKLTNANLLTAWFDILSMYCHKWLHGEKLKPNENFEETKLDVTASNDIFQDFIDSKLKLTSSAEDRIGKNEMVKAFGMMYPGKLLTCQQIINSLKEKGLKYDFKLRCKSDGVKGCYIGVKLQSFYEDDDESINVYKQIYGDDESSDDEMKTSPLDHGIKNINYKHLYEKSLFEIDQLKSYCCLRPLIKRDLLIKSSLLLLTLN